jgi:hypothetical protein
MYFPDFYSDNPDCCQCEKTDCHSRGKHQRGRKDFTYTSGRCPRLPDKRGFLDKSELINQSSIYPVVHAEMGCEDVFLSISIPGDKRIRKVYRTKSGFWYYNAKEELYDGEVGTVKKIIQISCYNYDDIVNYTELVGAEYCRFGATITDSYV